MKIIHQNELEAKLQLFGVEVIYEAFNQASYDVVSINDMGDKAELKIKVKGCWFLWSFTTNNNKYNWR